jgi:hypothetical protein
MSRTLLQIVQAAQNELGLPASTTVISNTDPTTVQMLAFAQQELDELRRVHNWTFLHNEYNLIVSPPVITTGDLTASSAVITNIPTTAALTAQYFLVTASGVPIASRILTVDSLTQVTMTMAATGASTGGPVTFSQDTYPEPTDFDHFENKTWYDRTNRWQLIGPDSPQTDQFIRSGIVALGPRRHFRQLGYLTNNWRIWPAPTEIVVPLQLVYEYISNYCVYVTGLKTSYSSLWANDSDVPILDDRAVIMGIKWRFWQQKGMNYAGMRMDYDNYVSRLIARDGGGRSLNLVPRLAPFLVSSFNVQDSGFPGPTGTNSS